MEKRDGTIEKRAPGPPSGGLKRHLNPVSPGYKSVAWIIQARCLGSIFLFYFFKYNFTFIDKTHITVAKFKTKKKVYNDITDWIKIT